MVSTVTPSKLSAVPPFFFFLSAGGCASPWAIMAVSYSRRRWASICFTGATAALNIAVFFEPGGATVIIQVMGGSRQSVLTCCIRKTMWRCHERAKGREKRRRGRAPLDA